MGESMNKAVKKSVKKKITTRKDVAEGKMEIIHEDGWSNLLTKMGTSKDNQTSDVFGTTVDRTFGELEELYRGDGLAKRIVDLPAAEMTRNWFDVTGDTEGDVEKALVELDAKSLVNKALRWGGVYGGALVVMLIDDGGELKDELDLNKINKVEELRVYDRFKIWADPTDIQQDPQKPGFGKPFRYQVNPIENTFSGALFTVHVSRVLSFDGVDISEVSRKINKGWGDSVYQAIHKQLSNVGGAYHSTRSILNDFIHPVLSIDNLQDLIAGGQENLVKARLEIMDLSRSILNTTLIDSKESYEKKASSVGGLDALIDRFTVALSAVSGIPHTLLMGQSPAGLNSTGESDIRFWYDKIAALQQEKMLKQMTYLVKIIMLSKQGPTNGKELDDWSIQFNPLWLPTEKEQAELRKIQSETDVNYINTGVLIPAEVAVSRFGGDQYSTETILEPGDRKDLITDPEDFEDKETRKK